MRHLARVWLLAVWCGASWAGAFSFETHFDLTLYFGLHSCLSFPEALLVASSDQGQDGNASVVAEKDLGVLFGGVTNQRNWHALDAPDKVAARDEALRERALAERDPTKQLIFLGQWLHFTQDVVAHRGFQAPFGHAFPTFFGHDPDSLAYPDNGPAALARALEMATRTLNAIGALCQSRGQAVTSVSSADEVLLNNLMPQSDFSSRAGSLGSSERSRAVQRSLRALVVAALPVERLPVWLRASSDRACQILALHRWLMPAVNAQAEPLQLEAVAETLGLIAAGSAPPPIPCP